MNARLVKYPHKLLANLIKDYMIVFDAYDMIDPGVAEELSGGLGMTACNKDKFEFGFNF